MLGESLRAARIDAGLSQQALADALEVCRETVSRIERGLGSPHTTTLAAWARICGVTTDSLLGIEPNVTTHRRTASGRLRRVGT